MSQLPGRDPLIPEPRMLPQRLETSAESVERDLVKLVLSIVELELQLME
jgi:hypothetical protein